MNKKILILILCMVFLCNFVSAFTVTEYKDNLVYSGKFLKTSWSIQVPITKVIETKPTTLKEFVISDKVDYKYALLTKYPYCIWKDYSTLTIPSTTTTTKEIIVTTTTKPTTTTKVIATTSTTTSTSIKDLPSTTTTLFFDIGDIK